MAARLLKWVWNAQVQVQPVSTTGPNPILVNDNVDWANFVNDTDAIGFVESAPCMAPGANLVIDLPPGITTAKAISWKFSEKVDLTFNYGIVLSSRYGIQEGEFTSLTINVPAALTADVTGHIVILG